MKKARSPISELLEILHLLVSRLWKFGPKKNSTHYLNMRVYIYISLYPHVTYIFTQFILYTSLQPFFCGPAVERKYPIPTCIVRDNNSHGLVLEFLVITQWCELLSKRIPGKKRDGRLTYFHFWNGVEVATRNKQWYHMRCPDSLIRWAQKLVVATHVILSDVGSFCNPSVYVLHLQKNRWTLATQPLRHVATKPPGSFLNSALHCVGGGPWFRRWYVLSLLWEPSHQKTGHLGPS